MGVVSILIKSRAGRDSVQATNRYLSSSNIVSPRREANVRLWSQFMILGLQRRAIHASIPLCLLLCLFAPARAQLGSGLSAATSAPGDKYSLSGTVVDSVSGEPIRRALVQIFIGDPTAVLTDSNGAFQFDDLPAGQTSIAARKPGFFTEQELGAGRVEQANVTIGPNGAPVTVKLIPGGVIFGHIANADGEAIEDIPVGLHYLHLIDGRKRWDLGRETRTDEQGGFRIANLPPGSYYLTAGPHRQDFIFGGGRRSTPARGYPQVFYPAGTDLASASSLVVAPGQRVQADLLLKLENFYEVSGTVSGYPPDSGVNIIFVNQSGDHLSFPTPFDPGTGEFHTRIPAGTYTLRAFVQDASASLPLVAHSDVTGIHLTFHAPITIPVITQGATPKRTTTFRFGRADVQPVNVRLISTGASLQPAEYNAMLLGDDEHRSFAVRNVEPGTYTVEVTPISRAYVQSVRCGDVDLLQEDLHVSSAAMQPIEVVLRDDVATLNGTVAGAEGKGTLGIVLVPEHGSARHLQTTSAGPNGQFQIGGLAPGDYSVMAFDRLDAIEFRNPEVLSSYLPRAAHVALSPSAEGKVTVNLIRVEK
jgi:carboxypeptidase family protein